MFSLSFLLGICLPSLWSPPFAFHALALIPALTRQDAAFARLDSHSPHDLILWTDGSIIFPFGKGSSSVLANCSLFVTLLSLFPFQQAQHVQLFLPKPAPFSTLCAGLDSINKSATSLLLLSDSRSVLATLSSPPSFLLPQSLWQELSFFFSCSVELQLVPGHPFLPGNDTGDKLARLGALLSPSAIPCSLSPLISCIYSSLFSDWRRTFSSKFSKTQAPSIFIEELVLPRHACCVPSRLRCNGHSFLLSYLSSIDRIESPFCIACAHPSQDIYHLILHCPTTDSLRRSLFGDSVYLRPLV